MRLVPFALAALVAGTAMIATVPAQAQDTPTRLIIRKPPPKSFLDPGTVVKPGSKGYLNYVDAVRPYYPQYGDTGGITGSRYPLAEQYYLPSR